MAKYEPSHLKVMNTKLVYQEFLKHESLFVKEISRATGISVPTVMKVIDFLAESELIVEQESVSSRVGRKPIMFGINKNKYYSIGMIYEGDYLHTGIVDLAGKVVDVVHVKCELEFESYAFESIDRLIESNKKDVDDLIGIGIGMHGTFEPESRKVLAPLIGLAIPKYFGGFIDDLAKKYQAMVIMENDANVQAFGEYSSRTHDARRDMIYITLGSGLGAGMIVDGKVRAGERNICGEIGYYMFDYEGEKTEAGWLESQINLSALRDKFKLWGGGDNPQGTAKAIDYVANKLALVVNILTLSYDIEDIVLDGHVVAFLGEELIWKTQEKVNKICYTPVEIRGKNIEHPGITGGGSLVSDLWLEELFKR